MSAIVHVVVGMLAVAVAAVDAVRTARAGVLAVPLIRMASSNARRAH